MTAPFDPNAGMCDLSPIIRDAAAGVLDAQRQGRSMAMAAMNQAAQAGDYLMGQGHAMEAMFWARFAASHGQQDDAMVLAAVLISLAASGVSASPSERDAAD